MKFEMRYQINLIFTYIERNISQVRYETDSYLATGANKHVMACNACNEESCLNGAKT